MVNCDILTEYLHQLLQADQFSDGCPNGLQIQGKPQINKMVTGVTASQALIQQAIKLEADAILVHHGYFWKSENASIVGMKYHRIKAILDHDINLFAYHLPLDAHAAYGNNALLCQVLGGKIISRFGDQDVGFLAQIDPAISEAAFIERVKEKINPKVFVAGKTDGKAISKIAVCSGGGQSFYQEAIKQGADIFLTGEIAEHNVHEAEETGIPYIAAGHHATERFGVRALGCHLAKEFSLDVTFVDIDSGV